MQLQTVNLINYAKYAGYQHSLPLNFTLCKKLSDTQFEPYFVSCMCNDSLRAFVTSKWSSITDKENFYLIAAADTGSGGLNKVKIIKALNFVRKMEEELDWEQSTYSEIEKNDNKVLIYVNPNWILTPYLFSFLCYSLRSFTEYDPSINYDDKTSLYYIRNHSRYDKFNSYINKLEKLFNEKHIDNQCWENGSRGFQEYVIKGIKKEMIVKKKKVVEVKKIEKITGKKFRPQIRSRHPSHDPLRTQLEKLPFRSIVRMGSTTHVEDGVKRIELNPIEAIKNSSSKLRMKNCFKQGNVQTADWIQPTTKEEVRTFFKNCGESGIVTKSHFGSRGKGNTLIRSSKDLETWLSSHGDVTGYVVERFYNYNREYRLHVSKDGCFYTCRKMLKQDTPEDKKWFRNDSNSVWIMETNPSFDKPVNWSKVITESVKALKSCGLDFGAVDLRIQSAKDGSGKKRVDPDFIVVEINSAPSFGEVTLEKYLEVLPKLLTDKYNQ